MQIAIAFRRLETSDAIKAHIEEKMEKLARFFSKEPIRVHVVLSHEKFRYGAEVTVTALNLSLTCQCEADDLYAAFDQVYHKLEAKVRRHKEKVKGHKGSPSAYKVAYEERATDS
jgi:putative sigma-54 modulation protein